MNSRFRRHSVRSFQRQADLLHVLESRLLFSFVLQAASTSNSATATASNYEHETSNPAHAEDTFSYAGTASFPGYSLDATSNASYQVTAQQITVHNDATQTSTPAGSLWPDSSGADAGTDLYFTLTAAATVMIHGALSAAGGGYSSVSLEGFRADSSNTTAFNQQLQLSAGDYIVFVSADAADNAGFSDSSATADVYVNISGGSPPAFTSPNTVDFQIGIPSHFTVTTTGSPTPSIKETAFLPKGITFVDNHDGTATLAGTPKLTDASGHYDLIFSASNGVSVDATHPAANQFFTLNLVGSPAKAILPARLTPPNVPAQAAAGATLPPIQISLTDKSGNVVTTANSLVTLKLSGSGGGVLQGVTAVQAVNGVATFSNLSITKAGTYTLTAMDGALHVKSRKITIVPEDSSAHLVITRKPAGSAVVGRPLSVLTAVLEDRFGNIIRTNNSAVTLAVASGPVNGVISGTTTLHLAKGSVTFKHISLSPDGEYVLQLVDASLPQTSYPAPTVSIAVSKRK